MRRLVMAAVIATAPLAGLTGAAEAFQPFPRASVARPGPALHLAQAIDPMRVAELEEQIRNLNGRIEEMSFQLLQMQEQIRKFQEDNEFRFQELEKGGARKSGSLEQPVDAGQPAESVAGIIADPQNDLAAIDGQNLGAPEQVLGSIEMDENGMPMGATFNDGALDTASAPLEAGPGSGTEAAALPGVDSAPSAHTGSLGSENDVYQAAYGHVLSGDYAVAEKEFTDFIARYPESKKIADASFWLGEAQYSQGDFNGAAKTFLDAHQAYSMSSKAPEMLLKLGMSMAQLENKDAACAVFREVGKRYPQASRAVSARLTSEQKRLSC